MLHPGEHRSDVPWRTLQSQTGEQYSMQPSLPIGAAIVVNSTTAASSHMPC